MRFCSPEVLANPTASELRNGWDPQSLTEFLWASSGSDFDFRAELLRRAEARRAQCVKALAKFKSAAKPKTACGQKALSLLKQNVSAAEADAALAAKKFAETHRDRWR
jgi:hypothetical protein